MRYQNINKLNQNYGHKKFNQENDGERRNEIQ